MNNQALVQDLDAASQRLRDVLDRDDVTMLRMSAVGNAAMLVGAFRGVASAIPRDVGCAADLAAAAETLSAAYRVHADAEQTQSADSDQTATSSTRLAQMVWAEVAGTLTTQLRGSRHGATRFLVNQLAALTHARPSSHQEAVTIAALVQSLAGDAALLMDRDTKSVDEVAPMAWLLRPWESSPAEMGVEIHGRICYVLDIAKPDWLQRPAVAAALRQFHDAVVADAAQSRSAEKDPAPGRLECSCIPEAGGAYDPDCVIHFPKLKS